MLPSAIVINFSIRLRLVATVCFQLCLKAYNLSILFIAQVIQKFTFIVFFRLLTIEGPVQIDLFFVTSIRGDPCQPFSGRGPRVWNGAHTLRLQRPSLFPGTFTNNNSELLILPHIQRSILCRHEANFLLFCNLDYWYNDDGTYFKRR